MGRGRVGRAGKKGIRGMVRGKGRGRVRWVEEREGDTWDGQANGQRMRGMGGGREADTWDWQRNGQGMCGTGRGRGGTGRRKGSGRVGRALNEQRTRGMGRGTGRGRVGKSKADLSSPYRLSAPESHPPLPLEALVNPTGWNNGTLLSLVRKFSFFLTHLALHDTPTHIQAE